MKLIIADTGTINYLLLIGSIDIPPALFQKIILPRAVRNELGHPDSPDMVQLDCGSSAMVGKFTTQGDRLAVVSLGAGETEALTLAIELHADLVDG